MRNRMVEPTNESRVAFQILLMASGLPPVCAGIAFVPALDRLPFFVIAPIGIKAPIRAETVRIPALRNRRRRSLQTDFE